MDDDGDSCIATMETGVQSRDDPFGGLYSLMLKIGGHNEEKQVVAVHLKDKTFVKRI